MTHIGLLCPTASGHLNPMTTLGYELKQRGHRVTLIGTMDAQSKVLAAGLEFWAIGEIDFPAGSSAEVLSNLGKLSGLDAFRYTVGLFKRITTTYLNEAPSAIKNAGIEALLVDQASFGGSTIAELLDLPFVSVCCALMFNRDVNAPPFITPWSYAPSWWGRLRNQLGYRLIDYLAKQVTGLINQYRQQNNLLPFKHPDDAYSQLAQICQQPAEFEFPRESLPSCFHFTGPYSNPASREPAFFPFDKLTGQPLIYASMGTVQNRLLEIFQTIAEACQDLDAQLVIALGGGSSPELLPNLAGSPLVVEFAPQLDLLKRSALTITHAGMNTTLESLSNGVPMVAIPIANDQPGVASRIAWTGAGEVVPLKRLNVSRLRNTIVKVFTEDSYKNNALRLQKSIQLAGGVKRAADIIEEVFQTGNPA